MMCYYTADYSTIDPMLSAWAQKRGLHIYTKYKDYEVRSVNVAGNSGKLYQIWVDAPDAKREIGVHAWDYKKRKVSVQSSLFDLGDKLEEAYATVMAWDEDFSKELSKQRRSLITSDNAIDLLLNERIGQGDFPSAVYLVAEAGEIVCANALGDAVRAPEHHAARLDTIYDLASLTKPLITSLLIAEQIQEGNLALETPVAEHLPEFRGTGVEHITVRELLTHTSGLPAWRPLYALTPPDAESVLNFIASCGFDYAPRTRVVYSDLGFITLGFLLERLTGIKLAELAQQTIFEPLKLQRTFFNPPPLLRDKIAASETGNAYEREMCRTAYGIEEFKGWREETIWGEVHDGNSYFLGGAAGHAGLFSTTEETMLLAEQFIAARTRLLHPETCKLFQTNLTEGLNEARSAGWQLAATPDSTAGERLPSNAFGHLGFAGTSLWIDAERERIFVLLTNRTHDRPLPFVNINGVRRRFHTLAVERLETTA